MVPGVLPRAVARLSNIAHMACGESNEPRGSVKKLIEMYGPFHRTKHLLTAAFRC